MQYICLHVYPFIKYGAIFPLSLIWKTLMHDSNWVRFDASIR